MYSVGRNYWQLPLERRYHPISQNFRTESQKDVALGQKDWVPCCLAHHLALGPWEGDYTSLSLYG